MRRLLDRWRRLAIGWLIERFFLSQKDAQKIEAENEEWRRANGFQP